MTRSQIVIGAFLSLATCAIYAQGVDCQRQNLSNSDAAICASASLLELDRANTELYESIPKNTELELGQQEWIGSRGRCNGNIPCIEAAYAARNSYLTSLHSPAAEAAASSIAESHSEAVETSRAASATTPIPTSIGSVTAPQSQELSPQAEAAHTDSTNKWTPLWVAGAIIVGLLFLWNKLAQVFRCKKCRKWFTREETDREEHSYNDFETVSRTDEHRNRDGRITGTTVRKEQIRVVVTNYKHHNRCKDCGYQWITTSQSVRR